MLWNVGYLKASSWHYLLAYLLYLKDYPLFKELCWETKTQSKKHGEVTGNTQKLGKLIQSPETSEYPITGVKAWQ